MMEFLYSHLLKMIPDEYKEFKSGIYYKQIPVDILIDFFSK